MGRENIYRIFDFFFLRGRFSGKKLRGRDFFLVVSRGAFGGGRFVSNFLFFFLPGVFSNFSNFFREIFFWFSREVPTFVMSGDFQKIFHHVPFYYFEGGGLFIRYYCILFLSSFLFCLGRKKQTKRSELAMISIAGIDTIGDSIHSIDSIDSVDSYCR